MSDKNLVVDETEATLVVTSDVPAAAPEQQVEVALESATQAGETTKKPSKWQRLRELAENRTPVEAKVIGLAQNRAKLTCGLKVIVTHEDISPTEFFHPGGELPQGLRTADFTADGTEVFEVVILKVDTTTRPYSLTVSGKAVIEDQVRKYLATVKVGDVVEGTISHGKPFGWFVNVGPCNEFFQALLPSRLVPSYGGAKPTFEPGQAITARIASVNPEKLELALTMQLTLEERIASCKEGSEVTGKVRRPQGKPFCFVNVNGVDAFLHDSDIPAGTELSDGQEITARVSKSDPSAKKLALSLLPDKDSFLASLEVGSEVTGTVRTLPGRDDFFFLDTRVFKGTVSAFVHCTEVPEDVAINDGDKLTARVIRVEAASGKVAVSLRSESEQAEPQPEPARAPARSRRPLRAALQTPPAAPAKPRKERTGGPSHAPAMKREMTVDVGSSFGALQAWFADRNPDYVPEGTTEEPAATPTEESAS